jgi:hypothetical protein
MHLVMIGGSDAGISATRSYVWVLSESEMQMIYSLVILLLA